MVKGSEHPLSSPTYHRSVHAHASAGPSQQESYTPWTYLFSRPQKLCSWPVLHVDYMITLSIIGWSGRAHTTQDFPTNMTVLFLQGDRQFDWLRAFRRHRKELLDQGCRETDAATHVARWKSHA
jgi:hypothetical protein